jgi:23S rRNA (cytidine1920-2'-O)/16S rRNA (cytidine1409-2'-O)-methyltransferase
VKPGLPLSVREGRLRKPRAHKLLGALDAFGLDVNGRVCLDVGASTGGFTDVMLRRGARRVYAVDVGYGLLDWRLRGDPRVSVMERTNARFLKPEMFPEPPEFGATDVSFISLRAVLPAALPLLSRRRARLSR